MYNLVILCCVLASTLAEANKKTLHPSKDDREARRWEWPAGYYALPRTRGGAVWGCPGDKWNTGRRRHDTETTNNWWSEPRHLYGRFSETSYIEWYFCTRRTSTSSVAEWPRGTYCIFRDGGTCPVGFTSGSIYWDDNNSGDNYAEEPLPDGTFTNHYTQFYFCCRSDGSTAAPIILPTYITKDFFLFPLHGHGCQVVENAQVEEDMVRWDTMESDGGNSLTPPHPKVIDIISSYLELRMCFYSYPDMCDSWNGGCDHYCHRTNGMSYCSCEDGYELAEDGRTCMRVCGSQGAATCGNPGIQEEHCLQLGCCYNADSKTCHVTGETYIAFEDKWVEDLAGSFHNVTWASLEHCQYMCDFTNSTRCKSFIMEDVDGPIDVGSHTCHLLEHDYGYYVENGLFGDKVGYTFYKPLN